MRVIVEFPPIYADALARFPAIAGMRPIFAWGDAIYNPHGIGVSEHLVAHEGVHGLRQQPAAGGPAAWWARYIDDPQFLLEQEVEAAREEVRSFCAAVRDRERRHRYALDRARAMAGPMYGDLPATAMQIYREITR